MVEHTPVNRPLARQFAPHVRHEASAPGFVNRGHNFARMTSGLRAHASVAGPHVNAGGPHFAGGGAGPHFGGGGGPHAGGGGGHGRRH